MIMADKVECRSDHAYLGYPVAFYWQGQRVEVSEVVSESHTPEGYTYRVRNDRFGNFKLTFDIITDEWSVEQL